MEDNKYKWFFLGGFILGMTWIVFGVIWTLTFVGFPVAKKCFQIGGMLLNPYGKEIIYLERTPYHVSEFVWFILSGLWIMLLSLFLGCVLCVSVIGFDYGVHCFKMISLAINPLDIEIAKKEE